MKHLRKSLIVAFLFTALPVYGFTQLSPLNPWVPPVNYFIDNGLLTNPGGPIQQAVQNAANEWSVIGNANFTFQFGGFINDQNYTTANNQMTIMGIANGAPDLNGNPLCVQNGGNSILGFALSFSNLNNQSVDGYIVICINVINGTQTVVLPWFVGVGNQVPAANQSDFGSVVTHELGHIVRLHHSCDGTLNNGIVDCGTLPANDPLNMATMRFATPAGSTNARTIEADDINGIQSIYGVFDPDFDDDGVFNPDDNCPNNANSDQADTDKDGSGDVCDADADDDGLSNAKEIVTGTDPLNQDTDGDGLSDGDEVLKYGSSPLVKDSDGDSVEDDIEIKNGTNPIVNEGAVVVVINSVIFDEPNVFALCKTNKDCDTNMECLGQTCFATCETKIDCPEIAPICLGEGFGPTTKYCITGEQLDNFFKNIFKNIP